MHKFSNPIKLLKKRFNEIFRRFVLINWKEKLFILFLAFIFWAFVNSNEQRISLLPQEIPIEIRNLDKNLNASLDTNFVKVSVAADAPTFQQLNAKKIRASIDLSGKSSGTFDTDVAVISTISNVEIISINPKKVLVSIENTESRELPVNIINEGKVADGKIISQITKETEKVRIEGATSYLKPVAEVRGILNLDNQNTNFTKIVDLAVVDDKGRPISYLTVTPSQIKISVTLASTENIKSVPIRLTTVGETANGFYIQNIDLSPTIVNIIGDPAVTAKVGSITAGPLNIVGLNQNLVANVDLVIPNSIALEGNLKTVKATIEVGKSDISRNLSIPISFKNLPVNKKIKSIEPAFVTSVISGELSSVNNIKIEDLTLAIDFGSTNDNFFSKTITLNDINAPAGITVLSVFPNVINITLE